MNSLGQSQITNANGARLRRSSHRSFGFTLVEVCLAMGIMTFTLIPLIGVMAMGLGQVATNIDNNQAVNIAQQVFVEARQMQFSVLAGKAGTPYYRYFSNSGDDLGTGTTAPANTVYTAIVTVNSPTTMPLPGGDSTQPSQPTLVTLSVQVKKTPGGSSLSSGRCVSSFVGMVSCEDLDYSGNSGI